MAVTGIPISELGAADTLTGAELVPLVQDGVTRRTTTAEIAAAVGGVAAAALAAGVNNDLVVVGLATASRVALTLAGDATLNGVAGGEDGMRRMLVNRSAVNTLTIEPEAAGSSAANRFASNGTLIVPPLCGAEFIYDGTNQRWVKT